MQLNCKVIKKVFLHFYVNPLPFQSYPAFLAKFLVPWLNFWKVPLPPPPHPRPPLTLISGGGFRLCQKSNLFPVFTDKVHRSSLTTFNSLSATQKIPSGAMYVKSGSDWYFHLLNTCFADWNFFDKKYISEQGLFDLKVSILYKLLVSEISLGNVIIMLTHHLFISCSWKFLYFLKKPAR